MKQNLPDAKISRFGRTKKLHGNETETVFLSWLGWLHQYFVDFSILPTFPCKNVVQSRGVPSAHAAARRTRARVSSDPQRLTHWP
jgi:hypothetical protein